MLQKKKSKKLKKPGKKRKYAKDRVNRRSLTKNSALSPTLNLKSRYEEIMDILSYANSLSEKDKEWLNAFVEEYVNANMRHKGKKLHKTKAARKVCWDKNNARNACVYSRAKSSGNTVDWDTYRGFEVKYEIEEDLINKIDSDYLGSDSSEESDD